MVYSTADFGLPYSSHSQACICERSHCASMILTAQCARPNSFSTISTRVPVPHACAEAHHSHVTVTVQGAQTVQGDGTLSGTPHTSHAAH